ncbi:MAG: putative quinol monooxygenase [Pseudomonadota bacterium]|nr:putative quinol monooxygenase [Pseudomonadota bacterium]
MIIIHGSFPIKSEGREEAIKKMQDMARCSRQESGCLTYEFYVGLSNPNLVLLFQEWSSVEALESHWETDHMKTFLGQLPKILDGEVATRRYEVRSNDVDSDMSEYEQEGLSNDPVRGKIVH